MSAARFRRLNQIVIDCLVDCVCCVCYHSTKLLYDYDINIYIYVYIFIYLITYCVMTCNVFYNVCLYSHCIVCVIKNRLISFIVSNVSLKRRHFMNHFFFKRYRYFIKIGKIVGFL